MPGFGLRFTLEKQRPDGAGGVAAEQRSRLGGSGGGTMTSGISLVVAGAGAAAASKTFTVTDAIVIFVVAVVLLTLGVALAGRRTRLLVTRPRLRTAHSRRIRRAALEDVEEIERDARLYRPGRDAPSREEENDDL
jgi:hypothetical protein